MSKYLVKIDHTLCQGFGACVEICSEGFYLSDDDGKSRFVAEATESNDQESIEVDDLKCYRKAEGTCPFGAITVTQLLEDL
jgi:ferredoxin